MTYKEKCSFDDKTWYELEWSNVDFREFDDLIKYCDSIKELKNKVSESFPNSNLKITEISKYKRMKRK